MERTTDIPAHGPIVCGVDPSGEETAAAQVAASLAGRLRARLVLVLVSPPPAIATAGMASQMAMLNDRALERGHSVLVRAAEDLVASGHGDVTDDAEGRVEFGEPAPRLAAVADELDAKLIVVGSRGRGRTGAALLGSVSQDLAAADSRPVLVVPPDASADELGGADASSPAGSVVCGVDESDHSASAVRTSALLAAALGVRLMLVHIDESGATAGAEEPDGAARPPAGDLPWIATLERTAQAAGVAEVESWISAGEPAETLETVAARESAALLVVGTRGHGALRALALGSVSRALASSDARPVVVVR